MSTKKKLNIFLCLNSPGICMGVTVWKEKKWFLKICLRINVANIKLGKNKKISWLTWFIELKWGNYMRKYGSLYLHVSINQIIYLKVLIVITKWIQKWLGNFNPSKESYKFQNCKTGYIHVWSMIGIWFWDWKIIWNIWIWHNIINLFSWIKVLSSK